MSQNLTKWNQILRNKRKLIGIIFFFNVKVIKWTDFLHLIFFTGPDGDRDFRPKLFKDWQQLGIGDVSPEKTLSATYISRAPSDQPFGKQRNEIIGEIGWFYKNYEHAIKPSYQVFMERWSGRNFVLLYSFMFCNIIYWWLVCL